MYHVIRVESEQELEELLNSDKYRKLQVKHVLAAAANDYLYYTVVFYGRLRD